MGLFHRHEEEAAPAPPPKVEQSPRHSGSMFHRRDRDLDEQSTTTNSSNGRHNSVLHRGGNANEDSSITGARDRVMRAEVAEKEADRALHNARMAVREAREHVKRLEKEAAEEARLAKIKQSQAAAISKRGKGLGRFD
jgi:hypothetical protein